MRCKAAVAAALLIGCVAGCDLRPPRARYGAVAPVPRRTVVWLDETGVNEATAAQLRRVGVDLLVADRGSVNLSGNAPVFRLAPGPVVAGSIPVALALGVQGVGSDVGEDMASAVWRAIVDEVGESIPAEIILDFPRIPPGVAEFVEQLSAEAGVPVIPMLSIEQLRDPEAVRTARSARACLVPVYGTGHPAVRGVRQLATQSLFERLAPLAESGVKVRLGVSLRPLTDPELPTWGEDLNLLTEPENAKVSTSSVLDRTFVPNRALEWTGRSWRSGESIAMRWQDAARLDAALSEMDRLVLPELAGWDLMPLPPEDGGLGITREALIRYLGGEGPGPTIELGVERKRSTLTVTISNLSPFSSAVTGVSNWVELSVDAASVVVEERGEFDRTVLGSIRQGEWQPRYVGVANAVRFFENYVAAGEEITTGTIRISSSKAKVRVRWQVALSSGENLTGEYTP